MAERWRTYIGDAVQRKPARALLVVVGFLTLAAGVLGVIFGEDDRVIVAGLVVVVGGVTFMHGCTPLSRIKATKEGFDVVVASPQETVDDAGEVSEPTPEQPAAIESGRRARDDVSLDEVESASRFLAGEHAVTALLTPDAGPLRGCDMHLYSFDENANLLLPIFEVDDDHQSEGWPSGDFLERMS